MDTLSHGLWGSYFFGKKKRRDFWAAFTIGMAPDLLSFGVFFVTNLLGITQAPNWKAGPPDPATIPQYVHGAYNVTHSFVTFGIVFLAIWLFRKKPWIPLWAWALHIIMDIPTHSRQFFPTPFLWPLSDVTVDGIPWSVWWIFFPNLILLIILYVWKYKKSERAA